MSDEGVTFKKPKPKRGGRARDLAEEDDGAVAMDTGEDSPSVVASKVKSKHKARKKPQTRLSFGGPDEEGDGEVFQVKKSNLSRKLTLNRQEGSPAAGSPSTPSIATSSQPKYDAAYLSELKAATPSARPRLEVESTTYDADVSMDPDALQSSTLVDLTVADDDIPTVIPSSSSIQAAKQKRERMRATGVSEDFISLTVSKREDQGPHPMSRLVREEDELGEGDDEFAEYTSAQERIALGKKSKKLEAKKKRQEMNELIADAEEQDEETMEWEQEQLRRGGHGIEEVIPKPQKATYKPAAIPPATPIPTLGPAIARLTQSLSQLTTSHSEHTASMASLDQEQKQLEMREKEMRELIAKAEEKRSWFAAFREWVESVATFLDEKFPLLENLEDEQLSLLQERYDMVEQRRRADEADDLSLFLGALPTTPQEDEMDDLGRVVPQANPAVARKERRSAREARRIHRRARGVRSQEEEGYSTDASLPPPDAADYSAALEKVLEKSRDILSDVRAKDFLDPRLGLGKWFGDWRSRFSDIYVGAWGGLGMISAWEFWTRLEIIGWNPIESKKSLDSFKWYTALHEYSHPPDESGGESALGPDGDLVSAMISTAIIPRIAKIVERGGLDPYSLKDVRRLIDLCEEVEISVPKDNIKFELIFKAAFTAFHKALSSTEATLQPYLQLNQPKFDPEAIPARRRYLSRQRKLLNNIIRWRKFAGEKYGIGKLVSDFITNVVLPVAETGWDVGGEEIARKIVDITPAELIPVQIKIKLNAR
ncbi:hypothetical protein K474DRAFT_1656446 [Panus rudis PR-1116 ss-1]|nr:hypothetical protein K474DRAFT_1656446 [Panus rudis PR-1116 ss-1]